MNQHEQRLQMAQAIVAAHGERFGAAGGTAQPQGIAHGEDPVHGAAKAACLHLGFIEIDADVLAHAWQACDGRPRPASTSIGTLNRSRSSCSA